MPVDRRFPDALEAVLREAPNGVSIDGALEALVRRGVQAERWMVQELLSRWVSYGDVKLVGDAYRMEG